MSRQIVAATLAVLTLASILTPAAARSFGPARAISISNPQPTNRPLSHHYQPYRAYFTNGFVAPFGLGTGGLSGGGPGGCPPSICGHPHPQVR